MMIIKQIIMNTDLLYYTHAHTHKTYTYADIKVFIKNIIFVKFYAQLFFYLYIFHWLHAVSIIPRRLYVGITAVQRNSFIGSGIIGLR